MEYKPCYVGVKSILWFYGLRKSPYFCLSYHVVISNNPSRYPQ